MNRGEISREIDEEVELGFVCTYLHLLTTPRLLTHFSLTPLCMASKTHTHTYIYVCMYVVVSRVYNCYPLIYKSYPSILLPSLPTSLLTIYL